MKPREVIAMCREKEVKAVDLRFVDFLGTWQHFTIPVAKLEEEVFEHLVSTKEIGAYKHPGFWKSMNSLKDTLDLNNMVKNNEAIWKVWEANKNEG